MIENIRNIAIGVGVMILLPLLTHVGVRLIIKEPVLPADHYVSPSSKASLQYQADKKEFDKYHFYITTGVGIAAVALGIIVNPPFLGMGLILGGVSCLVMGYFNYWDKLNDVIKFISLLLALLILIFSSFKFVRTGKK